MVTPRQSSSAPAAGVAPRKKSGTAAPGWGVRRAAMAAASSSRASEGAKEAFPQPDQPRG